MPTPARPACLITTAIPYVNARPHVGFAMELVLADALARFARRRGRDVRLLTGTDENSLKNVRAAEAEGCATAALVERNAAAFRALQGALGLSFDDFIRTSAEPRHRAGAAALWRACAERGDIYRKAYRGRYCVGCEVFYQDAELDAEGRCPEHGAVAELVEEENYFFRLSRYAAEIRDALASGALRVAPEHYRDELLALVDAGLEDFSVSRSAERARGWGIPVPGDPAQVMYVWFDALGNYITALDFAARGPDFARYWLDSRERVHVIGKGITRFHAIYWPAILRSAGLPLPTAISVHGYLTVDGRKIGKSLGNAIDPAALAERYGVDPLRWLLCRHVRSGRDADFSAARLAAVNDGELADQLGNLLHRTVAMIRRYYDGRVPAPAGDVGDGALGRAAAEIAAATEAAVDDLRIDEACAAAWSLVELANKHVVERAPWRLAKRRGEPAIEAALATTLYELAAALRLAAVLLGPAIPRASATILSRLGVDADADADEPASWSELSRFDALAPGSAVVDGPPLFPKLGASAS
ncbi:MAG: methionine--tRNA ligase [Nannocystaceae bacterium]